jgi:2-polyprenyl-3-methyl-5-hydroxy-6-metoxy-1,4-benzoquinol methylase
MIESEGAAVAGRLFSAAAAALELYCVHLGRQLGFYELLHAAATTAEELAALAGTDVRYTVEWLRAQTISGFVHAEADPDGATHYCLAEGVAEVMLQPASSHYVGPVADYVAAVGPLLPELRSAMQTGAGVAYERYGTLASLAQSELNRPFFTHALVDQLFPLMPGLESILVGERPAARLADVGCGMGLASVEIAVRYPHVQVVGYDSDRASIIAARASAKAAGVDERVTFVLGDIAELDIPDAGLFDVVLLFESLQDMGDPQAALCVVHNMLARDAHVIVVNDRVDVDLAQQGDEVQRFFGAANLLWCLPQGRAGGAELATGTFLGSAQTDRLARSAGFHGCEEIDLHHDFYRFLRLLP